jgi:hypothetical protein
MLSADAALSDYLDNGTLSPSLVGPIDCLFTAYSEANPPGRLTRLSE